MENWIAISMIVAAVIMLLLVCCSTLCYIFCNPHLPFPRPRRLLISLSGTFPDEEAEETIHPPPGTTGLEELGVVAHNGILCFLPGGSDAPLCFVCCESVSVGNTGPCGHCGMCGLCYAKIWSDRRAKCPICRSGKDIVLNSTA